MKLSPRLQAVLDMVEPCEVLADIGCDHALLAIAAVRQGKARHVFATDINLPPVLAAQRNVATFGMEDSISVVIGNGLNCLPAEALHQVVIAGMGGRLIRSILEKAPAKEGVLPSSSRFILQPMNHQVDLRLWLADAGWQVDKESIIHEKRHYYQIIAASPGAVPYKISWLTAYAGTCNLAGRKPEIQGFINRGIAIRLEILADLENGASRDAERAKQIKTELKALQEYVDAHEIC